MKKFIDNLSFPVLIVLTLLLGSAPFGSQPHLIEKINMLMVGELSKAIDIFDLIMHSAPIVLLIIKTLWFYQDKMRSQK